jgi:hypothetical protein
VLLLTKAMMGSAWHLPRDDFGCGYDRVNIKNAAWSKVTEIVKLPPDL